MFRKLASTAGLIVAAAALALPAFAQETVAKFSTTVVRPMESYALIDHVAERVKELTGGKTRIEILPPFASERDMFEGVLLGHTQFQASSVEAFGQWVPEARVLSLPFFYKSLDEAVAVANGPVGDLIKKKAEAKGFVVFGMMPIGQRLIVSKTPIAKLADFKGKKVRIINSPIWISLYQAFGAIPVPMDWNDTYQSLQSGVIDALDSGLGGSMASKHYEVAKNAVATNHSIQFQVIAASSRWWKSLTDDQRKAVSTAMAEALPIELEVFRKALKVQSEEWIKLGGSLAEPSEEFRNEIQAAAAKAAPAYVKVVGGEEIIKLARQSMGQP